MKFKNEISEMEYPHYHDYNFKSILQERANGLLKFLGIPYLLLSVVMPSSPQYVLEFHA